LVFVGMALRCGNWSNPRMGGTHRGGLCQRSRYCFYIRVSFSPLACAGCKCHCLVHFSCPYLCRRCHPLICPASYPELAVADCLVPDPGFCAATRVVLHRDGCYL